MSSEVREYNIPLEQLNVTTDKILRCINIQDGLLSEFSREILENFLKAAHKLAVIKGGFVNIERDRVLFSKNLFHIDEVVFHSEKIITPRLKKSVGLAIFVASAGGYFEEESKKYISGGDAFTAYLIDAAASEIVEAAAEWIEKEIGIFADGMGLKTTSRYSPGYCSWKVAEQHKLFSFLPKDFCGIQLTSSSLMIPIKSISGIIGIGTDVKKEDYECEICEELNCFRRKISLS